MSHITDVAEAIRENQTALQIGTAIQAYLDDKYINNPDDKPTIQEWTQNHRNQIFQWLINEQGQRVIEAFLMTMNSDPAIRSLGNDRLLSYATIYEDLRDKLELIINYTG
ncbi:MAG: hypothetical protein SVK08_01470 [Halobacteriota archaeon]|nr:hypothetical protein [Halobacteriota archaeon]